LEVPVKPETTRGARRLVPRRRRSRGRPDALVQHGDATLDARSASDHADFDPAEFAEFLEADESPIAPDPAFRERLRQELWGMVRSQAERRRTSSRPPVKPLPDPKRRS
jgi:hypothetical protein